MQIARQLANFTSLSDVLNRSFTLREALDGERRLSLYLDATRGTIESGGQPDPVCPVGTGLAASLESHRHASVPLIAQDQVVGILNLLLLAGRTFSDEELAMLESIGHEMAVSIQRARLFEQVRDQEHTRRELLQRLLVAQEEQSARSSSGQRGRAGPERFGAAACALP
jgi:hypothetical protein